MILEVCFTELWRGLQKEKKEGREGVTQDGSKKETKKKKRKKRNKKEKKKNLPNLGKKLSRRHNQYPDEARSM